MKHLFGKYSSRIYSFNNTYTYKEPTTFQALYQVPGCSSEGDRCDPFLVELSNAEERCLKQTNKHTSTVTMTRAKKVGMLREPWGTLTMFGLEKTFLEHQLYNRQNVPTIAMIPPYAFSPVIAHLRLSTFAVCAGTLVLRNLVCR